MPRLRYLTDAQRDILDILDYIEQQSGSAEFAERFVSKLRKRCRDLANLPGTLGRARPELRPEMRSMAYRTYVIFFQYRDNALEIVNILEGHRDLDAHFNVEH